MDKPILIDTHSPSGAVRLSAVGRCAVAVALLVLGTSPPGARAAISCDGLDGTIQALATPDPDRIRGTLTITSHRMSDTKGDLRVYITGYNNDNGYMSMTDGVYACQDNFDAYTETIPAYGSLTCRFNVPIDYGSSLADWQSIEAQLIGTRSGLCTLASSVINQA